jgi:two-component system chemotaxis response regulator CheB/chemosensory pili system protein ChpB (putative protein-glutamate methylesterase)
VAAPPSATPLKPAATVKQAVTPPPDAKSAPAAPPSATLFEPAIIVKQVTEPLPEPTHDSTTQATASSSPDDFHMWFADTIESSPVAPAHEIPDAISLDDSPSEAPVLPSSTVDNLTDKFADFDPLEAHYFAKPKAVAPSGPFEVPIDVSQPAVDTVESSAAASAYVISDTISLGDRLSDEAPATPTGIVENTTDKFAKFDPLETHYFAKPETAALSEPIQAPTAAPKPVAASLPKDFDETPTLFSDIVEPSSVALAHALPDTVSPGDRISNEAPTTHASIVESATDEFTGFDALEAHYFTKSEVVAPSESVEAPTDVPKPLATSLPNDLDETHTLFSDAVESPPAMPAYTLPDTVSPGGLMPDQAPTTHTDIAENAMDEFAGFDALEAHYFTKSEAAAPSESIEAPTDVPKPLATSLPNDLDETHTLFSDAVESPSAMPAHTLPDTVSLGDLMPDQAPTTHTDIAENAMDGFAGFDALEAHYFTKPEAAAPSEPVETPVEAKRVETNIQIPPSWKLEDIPDEKPFTAHPRDFNTGKTSAAESLAPRPEAESPPAVAEAGATLERIPLEKTAAPKVQHVEHETRFDPATQVKVKRVWVLGASIGGPEAVREFLSSLPSDYPALFLLAQHLGEEFIDMMTQQLAQVTKMVVRTPAHGDRVGHGDIVVVPAGKRLRVDTYGVVTLERTIEKTTYRPSIDRVLRDTADRFGANAGAVVFSGMGEDAIEGSKYLAEKGGVVYVQDPDSCVISTMVKGVRAAGVANFVGSPRKLAEKLLTQT